MADATIFSREQRAAADFSEAMSQIRSRHEVPEGRHAVDALTEAAMRFATCERRMRRSERLRALDLRQGEAKELAESALAENELGLTALPGVQPYIDHLSKQETDAEALALWRESSPRLRAEWREHVAELDLSAEHAQLLNRIADECCDAVDAEGFSGLGRHISRHLEELDEARRSEDRGTRAASFPYWKIVLAAIFWGIGVGWTIDLISRGAPWWAPFLVWLLIAIITFIIALGC